MGAINGTLTDVSALQDRFDITDVLCKYSSCVDSFDYAGVRSVLADDIHAQYGNADPVTSGDALAAWIEEATQTVIWQHHLLSVYSVEIDGDEAKTLSYLTSYQVFQEAPDHSVILVARYHDELRRTADGWKIAKRVFELLSAENRKSDGMLETIGGRGPKIWSRD